MGQLNYPSRSGFAPASLGALNVQSGLAAYGSMQPSKASSSKRSTTSTDSKGNTIHGRYGAIQKYQGELAEYDIAIKAIESKMDKDFESTGGNFERFVNEFSSEINQRAVLMQKRDAAMEKSELLMERDNQEFIRSEKEHNTNKTMNNTAMMYDESVADLIPYAGGLSNKSVLNSINNAEDYTSGTNSPVGGYKNGDFNSAIDPYLKSVATNYSDKPGLGTLQKYKLDENGNPIGDYSQAEHTAFLVLEDQTSNENALNRAVTALYNGMPANAKAEVSADFYNKIRKIDDKKFLKKRGYSPSDIAAIERYQKTGTVDKDIISAKGQFMYNKIKERAAAMKGVKIDKKLRKIDMPKGASLSYGGVDGAAGFISHALKTGLGADNVGFKGPRQSLTSGEYSSIDVKNDQRYPTYKIGTSINEVATYNDNLKKNNVKIEDIVDDSEYVYTKQGQAIKVNSIQDKQVISIGGTFGFAPAVIEDSDGNPILLNDYEAIKKMLTTSYNSNVPSEDRTSEEYTDRRYAFVQSQLADMKDKELEQGKFYVSHNVLLTKDELNEIDIVEKGGYTKIDNESVVNWDFDIEKESRRRALGAEEVSIDMNGDGNKTTMYKVSFKVPTNPQNAVNIESNATDKRAARFDDYKRLYNLNSYADAKAQRGAVPMDKSLDSYVPIQSTK